MGTIATISAANPESIYFSDIVTPPLPPRSKQAPIIKDVRQFIQFDLPMPCDHAIAYMITPAVRKRVPAIKSGGMVSIANRIPRKVEPPNQIERGESDDDRKFCRGGHEAMTIFHSRNRANCGL